MDKIQKWLKKKEEENPSVSLNENPVTFLDRAKSFYRGLSRKVEYIPQEEPSPYESKEDNFHLWSHSSIEWGRKQREQDHQEIEKSLINARKYLACTLRDPKIVREQGRIDNLDD